MTFLRKGVHHAMIPIVWILLGILLISLLFSTLNYALRGASRSALEELLAIRSLSATS